MPSSMIILDQGNMRFQYRAVAVILHNDRLLIHKAEKDDFWALPGGRVEFAETSLETLIREMKEELKVDVRVERLLWVVESFFELDGRAYQEIGLYHLVSLPENSPIFGLQDFIGDEEGTRLLFRWCPLNQLQDLVVYPAFLKTGLRDLAPTVQYVVDRE